MNRQEYKELEKRLHVLHRNDLNVREFLDTAVDRHVLDKTQLDKVSIVVLENGGTDADRIENLIFEVAKYMTFSDVVDILELVGFVKLAKGLRPCCKDRDMSQSPKNKLTSVTVPRMTKHTDDSSYLIALFCRQKAIVDNKVYPNLKQYFIKLTSETFQEIKTCQNEHQKNKMGNQLAVITWVQTQLYRDVEIRRRIINRMWMRLAVLVDDTSFIDTVYYCKQACTAVLQGRFDEAKDYMAQAESHADKSTFVFAKTIVNHDRQFIYRKQNVTRRDPEHVSVIIRNCERGLDSLTDSSNCDSHVLLQRIFMLNMVQALLGIGTYLEIDATEPILNTKLQKVTELIRDVERASGVRPMENRRQMIVWMCKSRLAVSKYLPEEARSCLEQAKLCSEKGAISPMEKRNIDAYAAELGVEGCYEKETQFDST